MVYVHTGIAVGGLYRMKIVFQGTALGVFPLALSRVPEKPTYYTSATDFAIGSFYTAVYLSICQRAHSSDRMRTIHKFAVRFQRRSPTCYAPPCS
jgi:hypothetical protein